MTDNTRDPRIADLIAYALDAKPLEFQNTFNDIVTDRLVQAVSDQKTEIAATIFDDPVTPSDEVTVEKEEEDGQVT